MLGNLGGDGGWDEGILDPAENLGAGFEGIFDFVDGLEGKDSCCVENLDPVENLEGGEACWEENLEFVDDRGGELAPVEDLIGEEA